MYETPSHVVQMAGPKVRQAWRELERERGKGSEETSMQSLWQEVASLHCAAAAVLPFRPLFISLSPAPALASTCLAEAHYKSLAVSPCSSQCLPKIHDFVAATAASTRATHAHSHTHTQTQTVALSRLKLCQRSLAHLLGKVSSTKRVLNKQ